MRRRLRVRVARAGSATIPSMRRRLLIAVSLVLTVALSVGLFNRAAAPVVDQGGVAVWFSPDGGCADAVIDAVRSSNKTLEIAAYHITHAGIAKAIVDANRRRVSVRVVMDASQAQSKYSSATFLHNAGVHVMIWQGALMHHKFVIVDGKQLITGSFNFTKAADESNAENLLIIRDKPRVIAAYRQQFSRLVQKSRRYTPPTTDGPE